MQATEPFFSVLLTALFLGESVMASVLLSQLPVAYPEYASEPYAPCRRWSPSSAWC